jgi:PKD repeat protein
VVEENRSESHIIGNPDAPYITALANQNANFTQSFAETHPSQPNYLALFSGSTQGVTDDSCPQSFSTDNLASQLLAAGRTFAGYSESLPSVGYTGCASGKYARKHNPWVNWPAVPTSANQPFTAFPTDYSTLPDVSFVIPNLDNDMHDGTIAQGDTWLQNNLGGYIDWAKTHNSLLILTWDEDDNSGMNQIPTVFAGQRVVPGQYSESINHYSMLRTLEDAFGLPALGAAATASPILDVWSGSGGQPPVAAFTSSCSQLACTFDASGSADPDGTISSYAWLFGDSGSGSGVNPTHSYASAATYTVTLTVTDNDGNTAAVSRSVSPTAPPGQPFASDSFNRTVASGFGMADVGGAWTVSTPSSASVTPGAGIVRLTRAGAQVSAYLGGVSRTDADVAAAFSSDKVPAGSAIYVNVSGRRIDANNDYRTRIRITNTGVVYLRVARMVAGAETALSNEFALPGVTYAAGTSISLRTQVTGTAPSTVRARAWVSGTSEPSTWQVSATDSTAVLQAAGSIGITDYLSSAATNPPVTMSLTSFVGKPTTVPTNQPPTAAFISSCTNLACRFDATASSDPDGTIASYAWTFGDTTTGTGATLNHTYSSAGTYSVTLTVTDNGGQTGTVTHSVSVTAPTGQPFADDNFNRTVSGGWGSATTGGTWTTGGGASNFSVSPATGGALRTAAGGTCTAYLRSTSSTDTDLVLAVSLDKTPDSNGVYLNITPRAVSTTSEYRARVRITNVVQLRLTKLVAGTETVLVNELTVSGLTYAAGTSLTIRVQAVGNGTTTLRTRVWQTGTTEPSTWQASVTDSTAALQAAGAVGLTSYLSSGATVGPTVLTVRSLTARPTAT